MRKTVSRLVFVLLAAASLSLAYAEVIAREGKCYLERVEGQQILHLEGTHYEMGLAHGKLLAEQVKQTCKAFVEEWAVEDRKQTLDGLDKLYAESEPFLPAKYKDELRGLAEGAGLDLKTVQRAHALPERFHCTGAAAFGKATRDGKLYHTRSLDYALDIGHTVTVQENATVIVIKPNDEIGHVTIGWAGFMGCVSGMNEKGISIGEMGSKCRDEHYKGLPMIFMLRHALETADSLDKAIAVFRDSPRTCGFNFIVADGKLPDAVALEVSRGHCAVFKAGGKEEDRPPHTIIEDVVRRCNHFVDPTLAALQREPYDPRISAKGSWMGYEVMTLFLRDNWGKLDDRQMIAMLRLYPPSHSCLHQAVFCSTDLNFWVANARNPRKTLFAGAQNQTFYRYNLKKLLAAESAAEGLVKDVKAGE